MHDATTGREGPGAGHDASEVFARPHLVIDALPRAIVVTDLLGTIVGWNRAATELLGWSPDEVLGRSVLTAVAPGIDRSSAADAVASAEAGGSWEGDLVLRTRAGEEVQVHSTISPLRDEHGVIVGVVGASEDVTERREMERWAAELTDHLVLALSAGELGTFRWDMVSGATHWDPALERLFGLEPGTFPGTYEAWVAMLHPEDRDEVVAVVERAVAERTSYVMDHRIVWPDGTVRWLQGRGKVTVDVHGQVTGTIGCTADITARREAELAAEQRAADAEVLAEVQRRERQRLEFLTDITEAVLTTDSHQSFLAAVARRAVPELGDWCSIHFFPDAAGPPEVEVAHADPARMSWAREITTRFPYRADGTSGVPSVMRTGNTEHIPWIDEAVVRDALEYLDADEVAEIRQLLDELQLCSVITVPLRSRRRILGAMQFVNAESRRAFGPEDVTLAEAAAGRVADGLENLWWLEQHRHIATTLQAALLPPALPTIPGVSLAVRYWAAGAATEVGGDFYDVFTLDGDRWEVVIGDVCGSGPEAAALLGISRHTIRAAARHGADPHEVLVWLNDALLGSDRDRFCTAAVGALEHRGSGWHLRIACGGHPLPVVVRADGRTEVAAGPGTVLGVLPNIRTRPGDVELGPGDTVLLYTDGVTDVPPPYDLDASRVAAMASDAAAGARDADAVVTAFGRAVAQVLPIPRRVDDIALLVLRVDDA